jgi:uncharacterized membrane protein YfcA
LGPSSFAAAAAIGISLGLLGGGGSILTVPALVYWAGMPAAEATYSSLVVVGLTSASAAVQHAFRDHLHVRAALLFAATGIPAAFAGSLLSRGISNRMLLVLFAVLMLAAGAAMLLRKNYAPSGEPSAARVLAAGVGVGVLTGFFGVGGGFLVVPTLVLFAGLPMADAVGTSVAVIAFNCIGGFAGRFSAATPIRWLPTLEFSLVAIAGSFAGASMVQRIPVLMLRRLFALFVLAIAAFMIAKEAW